MKSAMMTRWMGITVLVVGLLIVTSPAHAGPDYQALKACLQNCYNTTSAWTWARLQCVLDCYADYVDSKLSFSVGPLAALDPDSSWGIVCEEVIAGYSHYSEYATCYGEVGVPADIAIRTMTMATHVDVLALFEGFGEFVPMGEAERDEVDPFLFHWSIDPVEEVTYLFVARFTESPSEDLDEAVVFYVTGFQPSPVEESTWGEIKSLFQ